ncbi:hypothetical protein A8F94_05245 [Bacillus sp. FJAT-27225]|uniref:type IV pilus modification PilV family protein n=1 Tax=Bacillus sp. FJAT-27225 TaxID=1743144 RepID=UPI00080C3173|nr:type II secretion system protein [Bacillus sp. FJAT-27225]OCA91267.1 hypothetical protein A8F94_05245 [Bacillus sp. FJAT-27225]
MDKKFHNQKGFTLLEVLLSIVLLAIILTSFLGFFTQSAIFNNKNELKLNSSLEAQKIVNGIELNITPNEAEFVLVNSYNNEQILNYLKDNGVLMDDTLFNIVVDFVKKEVDVKGKKTILYQAKIVVSSSGSKSETYTYVR